MSTTSLVLHVLAAAVLLGGEVLLFFAVTPATWLIDDEQQRRSVTRVVTRRFAALTIAALAVLTATGLYQFFSNAITPATIRSHLGDYRFGTLFMWKLLLIVVLLAMIAAHVAVLGPRIARASERLERERSDEARGALERLRGRSLLFSAAMVLVTAAVLALGVMLTHHPYSYVRR